MAVRTWQAVPQAFAGLSMVRSRRGWLTKGVLLLGVVMGGACATTDSGELPPNVQDPTNIRTPAGAVGYYQGILANRFPRVLEDLLPLSGLVTDELAAAPVPFGIIGLYTEIDSRQLFAKLSEGPYASLQRMRVESRDAREFLRAYAPDSLALQGHMYAAEGYTELNLADHFCSGIPLSTIDFEGDYTLAAGSTTTEVYRHALALFDTALTLVGANVGFQSFASIGRARALLALGEHADAAAAVAGVLDDFTYQVSPPAPNDRFWEDQLSGIAGAYGLPSVSNVEGVNGLNYRTSDDPRTAAVLIGSDITGQNIYFPAKYYPTNGPFKYTVASGIEARLIEAEAALRAQDYGTWLAKLNRPRQVSWNTITPAVGGPLPDLADPTTDTARVSLLFRERAFWLYLTAHRQGDLRRLIRQYQRPVEQAYPIGAYSGIVQYSREVVSPLSLAETDLNPNYAGCFNRNP